MSTSGSPFRHWPVRVLTALVCLAALGAPAAFGGVILAPSDDTFAQSNGSTHGSDPVLWVKWNDKNDGYHRKAWLKYDLSTITGGDFSGASLDLTFVNTGAGNNPAGDWDFQVYGLTDETLDGWSEGLLTWTAAPGNDTSDGHSVLPALTTSLGTFTVNGTGDGVTYSVSGAALEGFLAADTNDEATVIVVRDTRGTSSVTYVHGFYADEHTSGAPALLSLPNAIEGAPPPPPPPAPLDAHEPFTYATGDLDARNGGSGWAGPWAASGGSDAVVAPVPALSYAVPGGGLVDGGATALAITGDGEPVAARGLDETWDADDVFISCLIRWAEGSPSASDFGVIRMGGRGGPQFGFKIDEGSQDLDFMARMGESDRRATYAGQLELGETYLLVAHMAKGADGTYPDDYDLLELWVNPAAGDAADPLASVSQGINGFDAFSYIDVRTANFDSGDVLIVDELRLGTEWTDVVPPLIPEPCTLALLACGLGALATRRRRSSR